MIVSAPELVAMCRDKRETAVLFDRLKIERPAIYEKDEIKLPCFCKPYDGSCSIGAQAEGEKKATLLKKFFTNKVALFSFTPK